MYKYSIEIYYPNNGWVTEIRLYNCIKSNTDFDTKDINNIRRNFKAI